MWKPKSSAVDIGAQIATMVAQLHALEDSISMMNTSVQALGVVVRSMNMQHSVEKWMKVASVCGVVCFVLQLLLQSLGLYSWVFPQPLESSILHPMIVCHTILFLQIPCANTIMLERYLPNLQPSMKINQ
jgi:hypothetical protein